MSAQPTFWNLFLSLGFCCLFSPGLRAQINVSGSVIDTDENIPVIGATVVEKGTTNGVVTDVNGEFQLQVADTATLIIRSLGLQTVEEKVNGRSVLSIRMSTDATSLNEVIVTAFGIEKEKKAAGFSFSEVDGAELTQAREVNVAAQLAGKVAGLDITKPTTGPAGATRITIRGLSQLSGDNRPLIVIDGVPVDNSNINSAGLFGGRDSGDGLSSLNPDDIESITVLKGPSASALYGSRAGNGVLLVRTKKGRTRKGIGVEYTGNFVLETVNVLPNYQESYGQGANGEAPTTAEEAFNNWQSWGGPLDGRMVPIFNGEMLPYSAVGQSDLRDYYDVGSTLTNTLALTGGTDAFNARLSFSKLGHQGIVPETFYDKYTVNVLTRADVSKYISLEAKANYIEEIAENRTDLSDFPSNPAKYFTIGPANLPHEALANTRDELGNPIYWSNNPFTLSPYWGPLENVNEDQKSRFIGYFKIKLQLLEWLSLQARAATDNIQQEFLNVEIDGTQHRMEGAIWQDIYDIKERSYDIILQANRQFGERFSLDISAGATRNDRLLNIFRISGTGFINPGFISQENLRNRNPGAKEFNQSRINGLYVNALTSFNNFLYLDLALRRDYFSVLTNPRNPGGSENAITYGSAAASFVLSDAVSLPEWVSFAKLRLGYGTSGFGQIDPYSQIPTYNVDPNQKELPSGNVTLANINGDNFINPFLKPSLTTSYEVGADVRLLKNRLVIDLTLYRQTTDRHIFRSPLPSSTGYNIYEINAGEVRNQGIEALISYTVLKTKDLRWDWSLNITRNKNEVVRLADGVTQLNSASDRLFTANIISEEGGQIGQIWGTVHERDEQGRIVIGADGLPVVADERQVLGNYNPDWFGGLTSTLTYKGFSFSFLIDTKQGGELLSTTSGLGYFFGRHINSMQGRENPDFTLVADGVTVDGTPNSTPVRLDDYYGRISAIAENNVYDASYIKLRQLSFSYTFPNRLFGQVPIQDVTLSVVGRNLFFFQNGLSEIGLDPEALYTATRADVGFEYASLPGTRTFGFNLSIKL
ncbi:MAG: SusC/RagA family TonB-linked outer membrane protein [Bacteroidota bacterium]